MNANDHGQCSQFLVATTSPTIIGFGCPSPLSRKEHRSLFGMVIFLLFLQRRPIMHWSLVMSAPSTPLMLMLTARKEQSDEMSVLPRICSMACFLKWRHEILHRNVEARRERLDKVRGQKSASHLVDRFCQSPDIARCDTCN